MTRGVFNLFGLGLMVFIMIPNILYAVGHGGEGRQTVPKWVETMENIGRYGSMAFMVIDLPFLHLWSLPEKLTMVYVVMEVLLLVLYLVFWGILWKKNNLLKALSLSLIPSAMFLLSGAVTGYVPLLLSALVFAPFHVWISVRTIPESPQNS